MAKPQALTKRLAITKANTQMVVIVAIASFITVFCLVASRSVWSQYHYQSKVVSGKEVALKQIKSNASAFNDLAASYDEFDSKSTNILGANRDGAGDNDGSNSKIVLDALPNTYDFPALTSSIEKILNNSSIKITSIGGTDDQLNQQTNGATSTPQPVQMPFSFTVSNANYTSIQNLVNTLQRSIRPIQIDTLELSGGINDMTATVEAHTYYQPARNVNVGKKVIK